MQVTGVAVLAETLLSSPGNHLFLLSETIFTGSKYPKENRFILKTALLQVTMQEHMVIDPTSVEELHSDRSMLLAMQGPLNKVVYLDMHGVFTPSEVKAAMELSLSACRFYNQKVHEALTSSLDAGSPTDMAL